MQKTKCLQPLFDKPLRKYMHSFAEGQPGICKYYEGGNDDHKDLN